MDSETTEHIATIQTAISDWQDKIIEMKKEVMNLKTELVQTNKRITKLQDRLDGQVYWR